MTSLEMSSLSSKEPFLAEERANNEHSAEHKRQGNLGHPPQYLSSPSSAPMPTVVRMVLGSCLLLSLPSSHATQGFQEEMPPVGLQHSIRSPGTHPCQATSIRRARASPACADPRQAVHKGTSRGLSPGDRTHLDLEEGYPRGSWESARTHHPWVSSSQIMSL